MSKVLKKAFRKGIIENKDRSVIFYDLSFLKKKIEILKKTFPENTLHSIAIKANPLPSILSYIKPFGVGAEAATLPEVYLAQQSKYKPEQIIFDSPAKTESELVYALQSGVHINVDSFSELKRINILLKETLSKSNIGLRINPDVGSGKIKSTSVASKSSKFGIPLDDFYEEIKKAYFTYPWLNGIHLHIGSQGCSLEQLVNGVKKVYDLAIEINAQLSERETKNRIEYFDIGGGLPVAYKSEDEAIDVKIYYKALKKNIPGLLSGKFKLITEFGRHVHANSGWVASRVEYVKYLKPQNIAIIHVGADLLMRRCYKPEDWYHNISALSAEAGMKTEKEKKYKIAGPLCFNGDIIHQGIMLPALNENDFILIHDTGAYTLSMWSRHTSRQIPKVIGYEDGGEEFRILKNRERLEDVLRFWQ